MLNNMISYLHTDITFDYLWRIFLKLCLDEVKKQNYILIQCDIYSVYH